MNKLTTFTMTGLAAAVIGTGGLVAAPSAPAKPGRQGAPRTKAVTYRDNGTSLTWVYAPAFPK